MTLKSKVEEAIKTAMRAKDQDALRALRAIKSLILLAETAEGRTPGDLSQDEEMKLLMKASKQRTESARIFKEQNRPDLYDKEVAELAIIEQYLPAKLSDADIEAQLKQIIAQVGASSMKDMGKVMGLATKQFAGQADAEKVSKIVKSLLA